MKKFICNQKGLTVVEVVLASLVMIIIMGSIYTMVSGGLESFTAETNKIIVERSVRMASEIILGDLRKAKQNDYDGFIVDNELKMNIDAQDILYHYDADTKTLYKTFVPQAGCTPTPPIVVADHIIAFNPISHTEEHKLSFYIEAQSVDGNDRFSATYYYAPRRSYE